MTYPEWWQRLLAALIDGVIFVIVSFIITTILIGIGIGSRSLLAIMTIIATLVNTALFVGYKLIFEGGAMQATPGNMAFGIKVVDGNGGRAPMQQILMRTWPWWLSLIGVLSAVLPSLSFVLQLLVLLAVIGIFCTFFMAPLGRCLHDQTANLHVIKAGKGWFV